MERPNIQLMWMKRVIPRVWMGRPTFCTMPLSLAGVGLWKLVRLLCKAPLVVGWVVDLYAYLSVQEVESYGVVFREWMFIAPRVWCLH